MCPIQAQVFVGDQQRFERGCNAPPDRRQTIYATIHSKRCSGGHHVPGRYLCTGCRARRGREIDRYHYPWELQLLADQTLAEDFERADLRLSVIRAGLPRSLMSSAICATCTLDALNAVATGLTDEFEVLEGQMEL